MNALELALKKQRLQSECAAQRERFASDAQRLTPIFSGLDQVREAVRWLRRNPEILVVAGVAWAVARPRNVVRWARRGIVVWQGARKLRDWIGKRSHGTA